MAKVNKEMNDVEKEIEVEVEEEVVPETETQEESKFKVGLKKYGKKIAAGAALVAVGILGFALGRKSSADEELLAIDYDPDGIDDETEDSETE